MNTNTVFRFITSVLLCFIISSNGQSRQALFLPTILSRNVGGEGAVRWSLPELSEDYNKFNTNDNEAENSNYIYNQFDDDETLESEVELNGEEFEATGPVETSWLIDPEWFMVEESLVSDIDMNTDIDTDIHNSEYLNQNSDSDSYFSQHTIPTQPPTDDLYTELYDPSWRVVEDIVDSNNLRHIAQ